MWWDVYVPKVVADEHLREVTCHFERVVAEKSAEIAALCIRDARLNEIENSAGWKFVLRLRRIVAFFVRPDGRVGRILRRCTHLWLDRGPAFLGFATSRKVVKVLLRRRAVPTLAEPDSNAEPLPADILTAVDEICANAPTIHVTPEPTSATPTLHLYTSSHGNYFFDEIRDLIAAGLRQLGLSVLTHNENIGFFGNPQDWHLVLAPHEFFYLGAGHSRRAEPLPQNLILINTEQPSTHWFRMTADLFPKARWIWDIDYLSSQRLIHRGLPCRYLPLGFVPQFEPFGKLRDLPLNYGTCFLEPQVRFRSRLEEPLSVRPIDLAFFGNVTTRREQFFSETASQFAKYRTYFYFSDGTKPLLEGQTTHMNTATVVGLVQRSKVLLNIHRDEDFYFESHRIVMHGIAQRALVISEPCSPAPPFRPGIDFIEAPREEIARRVDYYLTDPVGRREAQEIADQGFRTLSRDCQLRHVLRPLLAEIGAEFDGVLPLPERIAA